MPSYSLFPLYLILACDHQNKIYYKNKYKSINLMFIKLGMEKIFHKYINKKNVEYP